MCISLQQRSGMVDKLRMSSFASIQKHLAKLSPSSGEAAMRAAAVCTCKQAVAPTHTHQCIALTFFDQLQGGV